MTWGRAPQLRDERGIALVMAMLVLLALAIALTSIIFFTSSNQRTSSFDKATQVARGLAEAGVNNGISVISNPANANYLIYDGVHTPTALLPDQAHAYTSAYPGGSVTWWGTFDWANMIWTVHATSTVQNPTGPSAAPIHRTMTANVQVNLPKSTTRPVGVWNWIYSPAGPSGGCDTTFAQSVTILVPVWVGGNLCIQNTVSMQRPVYVGGWVNNQNPQAGIGSSGSPVSEAYVGAGCQFQANPFYNPCVVDGTQVGGKPAKTKIWASTLYTSLAAIPPTSVFSGITAPQLCWGPGDCPGDPLGWYSVASPGPQHPCEVSSGTVPVFDTDSTPSLTGGSVPGVFNLTPDAYDYTCKTASGELSWNRATRTLTVQGVIFIDGSATADTSSNQAITYKGWGQGGACTAAGSCQAVLFLSGTFLIKGEHLCAVVNAQGNDCDPNAWDPNKKLLMILTRGQGGQLPAGQGVNVITNKSTFQGGLYANYTIVTGQGGWVQGPLVSGTQTIVVGQSTTLTFPAITISPFGILQPPGAFWINPPYGFTG